MKASISARSGSTKGTLSERLTKLPWLSLSAPPSALKPENSFTVRSSMSQTMKRWRVETLMRRSLKGVSQLVLRCASAPLARRNCRKAMSSCWPRARVSSDWCSMISEPESQRTRSMSWTPRSVTMPTSLMRGGNGPTREIAMEMMSSPAMASCSARIAGLKRSTWPTVSTTPFAAARSMRS